MLAHILCFGLAGEIAEDASGGDAVVEDRCEDPDARLDVWEGRGEVDLQFEDRAVEERGGFAEVGEGPEEGVGWGWRGRLSGGRSGGEWGFVV